MPAGGETLSKIDSGLYHPLQGHFSKHVVVAGTVEVQRLSNCR